MEKNHDWNGGEGSFQRTMDALRNLVKVGVPKVILIMTLTNLNYDELETMVKLSMNMGVDFTMVEFLPLGRTSEGKEWTLPKEQLERAHPTWAEKNSLSRREDTDHEPLCRGRDGFLHDWGSKCKRDCGGCRLNR